MKFIAFFMVWKLVFSQTLYITIFSTLKNLQTHSEHTYKICVFELCKFQTITYNFNLFHLISNKQKSLSNQALLNFFERLWNALLVLWVLNARIELATFSLRGRCSTNWANSANQPHNNRIIPKLAPVGKKC